MLDGAVVLAIGRADRILGVVAHLEHHLVDLGVAAIAEPEEPVTLARPPLALGDEREGARRKARRVRHAGRAVHVLALSQHTHLLLAVGRAVVEPHLPAELQHRLGGRIDVELAPVGATVGDEGEGLLLLPQHGDLPALIHGRVEIDEPTILHGPLLGHAMAPDRRSAAICSAVYPTEPSTSSVCSPTRAGGRSIEGPSWANLNAASGTVTGRSTPGSFSWRGSTPRVFRCGSARASRSSRTRAAGTCRDWR